MTHDRHHLINDSTLIKHILDEFTGFNTHVLAKRYNQPEHVIYGIIMANSPASAASKTQGNQAESLPAHLQAAAAPEAAHQTSLDDAEFARSLYLTIDDKNALVDLIRLLQLLSATLTRLSKRPTDAGAP